MREPFELSIDNPVLVSAKASLDTCLRAMVTRAISTHSNEGKASLTISMEIEEGVIEATGELVKQPVIKFKAGWSVPIKESEEGKLPAGHQLVLNPDGDWCLINNQVTIDEVMGGMKA